MLTKSTRPTKTTTPSGECFGKFWFEDSAAAAAAAAVAGCSSQQQQLPVADDSHAGSALQRRAWV